MSSHERGDIPAAWQCLGKATLTLPADLVARYAPGGSVIEYVDPDHTRLTLGAWSWAGIAGTESWPPSAPTSPTSNQPTSATPVTAWPDASADPPLRKRIVRRCTATRLP